ncbi:hypothetical protein [Roseibium alexandrii]|uniref:Uncharacterized protein n=1 Tax=Roseibium alexandrii TaxID=388408 RepID=A0A0M6ZXU4_9HYPH|nr:hypothetical protein [Roseibium alexandrii]CTQ67091.1 hypothetical protein LAX5112_01209 [Roseibium alexandrii]
MTLNAGVLIPSELAAGVQTDITGGGMASDDAGTFTINFCNDSDTDANLEAVYLTAGEAPGNQHKIHPAFIVAKRGWDLIQPVRIEAGWKLFIQSNIPISVQLIGDRRG